MGVQVRNREKELTAVVSIALASGFCVYRLEFHVLPPQSGPIEILRELI